MWYGQATKIGILGMRKQERSSYPILLITTCKLLLVKINPGKASSFSQTYHPPDSPYLSIKT